MLNILIIFKYYLLIIIHNHFIFYFNLLIYKNNINLKYNSNLVNYINLLKL